MDSATTNQSNKQAKQLIYQTRDLSAVIYSFFKLKAKSHSFTVSTTAISNNLCSSTVAIFVVYQICFNASAMPLCHLRSIVQKLSTWRKRSVAGKKEIKKIQATMQLPHALQFRLNGQIITNPVCHTVLLGNLVSKLFCILQPYKPCLRD